MKTCTCCGKAQEEGAFHKKASASDGLCGFCKDCAKAKSRAKYLANQTRRLEDAAKYRAENKESIKEYRLAHKEKAREEYAKYHVQNRAALLARYRARRAAKPQEVREASKDWRGKNPHIVRRHAALRRLSTKKATPAWARPEKISEFYLTADALSMHTGDMWHVDHIVPLNSPLVCGLHCEHNLQILPASENLSKSNRHWPDMP